MTVEKKNRGRKRAVNRLCLGNPVSRMVTGIPVNPGDFHKLRIYLLGNKALFENVFWVCEECILLCTTCFLFTLIIGRLSDFLLLTAVVCLLYVTCALASLFLLTSNPAPSVLFIFAIIWKNPQAQE